MSKLFDGKYVSKYQENYFKLPWYERDLMNYFDYLEYKDMSDEPDRYFKNMNEVNFGIIHHECRSDTLEGTYNNYKTIESKHLNNYPNKEAKTVLSVAFCNKSDDLWVKCDVMLKHVKEYF